MATPKATAGLLLDPSMVVNMRGTKLAIDKPVCPEIMRLALANRALKRFEVTTQADIDEIVKIAGFMRAASEKLTHNMHLNEDASDSEAEDEELRLQFRTKLMKDLLSDAYILRYAYWYRVVEYSQIRPVSIHRWHGAFLRRLIASNVNMINYGSLSYIIKWVIIYKIDYLFVVEYFRIFGINCPKFEEKYKKKLMTFDTCLGIF